MTVKELSYKSLVFTYPQVSPDWPEIGPLEPLQWLPVLVGPPELSFCLPQRPQPTAMRAKYSWTYQCPLKVAMWPGCWPGVLKHNLTRKTSAKSFRNALSLAMWLLASCKSCMLHDLWTIICDMIHDLFHPCFNSHVSSASDFLTSCIHVLSESANALCWSPNQTLTIITNHSIAKVWS